MDFIIKDFWFLKLELLLIKKNKNKFIVYDFWWFQSRNTSIIKLLKKIHNSKNINDFRSCLINTGDRPLNKKSNINVLSFSSSKNYRDIVIPDFIFDCWKEVKINDYNNEITSLSKAWKNDYSINKIGWVGNCNTHKNRWKLYELWNQYKNYFDIVHNDINSNTKIIPLEDLVKNYKYLIDIEWKWYSWRLKLLFFSWRCIFIQDRELKDYLFDFLIPYKNYIPIKNDLSDLVEKFKEIEKDNKLYNTISKNWKNMAETYLTQKYALNLLEEKINNLKFKKYNEILIFNKIIYLWIKQTISLIFIFIKWKIKITK